MDISLKELLAKLTEIDINNAEELKDWCKKLTHYYEMNIRHSYAEIAEYILDNSGGIDYSYEILKKLDIIYHKKSLPTDIQEKLQKLIDHIKLEQVRYVHLSKLIEASAQEKFIELNNSKDNAFLEILSSADQQLKESEKKLEEYYDKQTKEIDNKVNALRLGVDALSKVSIEAEDKVKNAQTENTAILGIFASIVLAFTGGMMFSSSIMENLNNSSFYRLFLICLVLGGILLNLISALLIYVNRIINYEHKTQNFFKENAFWIVINSLLVIGIVLTIISWKYSDEKKVNDSHNAYTIKMYENSLESISGNEVEDNN